MKTYVKQDNPTAATFRRAKGRHCPICNSDDTYHNPTDAHNILEGFCGECSSEWVETFALASIAIAQK